MNLSAVVLVGSDGLSAGQFSYNRFRLGASSAPSDAVACMDVLGRPLLHRVVANLQEAGVNFVSVLCPSRLSCRIKFSQDEPIDVTACSDPAQFSELVERKINQQMDKGASVVLLLNLTGYMEFEFGDVLEFHRDRGQMVTRVRDHEGPLNFWLIDVPRARNSRLSYTSVLHGRSASRLQYQLRGYSNRMRSPQDLRQLVEDSFYSRCRLRPEGKQARPGVWVAEGASVHRQARLVAPVYVGRNSRVEAGALITRGSSIEAGCTVGGGTVVEAASILPNTYLGQGLEISHAVVERGRLMHLKRNVAVDIVDPSLIGAVQPQERIQAFWADPVILPAAMAPGDSRFEVSPQVA